MRSYDLTVIGLGTAGSATCMMLARRGYSVLGVDAFRPPHAMGSHHGKSRSVRRAYLEGTAYVPMAMRAWALWRKLEKDTGQRLLLKTGNLTIGPPDSPAVKGFIESAQAHDIPHEIFTAYDVRRRWPQLAVPEDFCAGFEKEAGIVFPETGVAAFLAEAERAGAVLRFDERVDHWEGKDDVIVVRTSRGTFETGRLLIATGAWGGGLSGITDRLITPKRVPVHWIASPEDDGYAIGRLPVTFWQVPAKAVAADDSVYREFYFLPVIHPDNRIKTAFHNGLVDCDPDNLIREASAAEVAEMRAVVDRYLPGLSRRSIQSEVCMYAMTRDGHFFLGPVPGLRHVFIATLAGHGFKFAPVLGEILADLMIGIPPAFNIDMFSAGRFSAA